MGYIILLLVVVLVFLVLIKPERSDFNERGGILTYADCPPKSEKNMFRTWKNPIKEVPDELVTPMNEAMKMNPEYDMYYFSDEDVLKFIGDHFPDDLDAYNSLVPGAYKADVFRLMVLYKYGGVYNDIGHTFLVPIEEIKGPTSNHVFVKDMDDSINSFYWIHDAFIIAPAGSEIIKKMLDRALTNVKNKSYGENMMDIAGPSTVGKALNMFWGKPEKTPIITGEFNNVKIIQLDQGYINSDYLKVIKTKIDKYTEIVYSDDSHYGQLYSEHKVYK
jgi:mannosyltransferase OCH1-like enzyme